MMANAGDAERVHGGRYQWRLVPPAPDRSEALARALSLPPLVGALLWNRGLPHVEEARAFLTAAIEDLHDPFLMKDMGRAVERTCRALANRERIIVYGDYDADGVCATALMAHFFREIGHEVEIYIPDRLKEGYGLNTGAILGLGAKGKGLLITVDNGITNNSEVEAAQSIGLDVIITDHHQPPDRLPKALAILNPHRRGCHYPDKSLCGTAIAFKFLAAMRRGLLDMKWPGTSPNLRRHLDLVALATVADVVTVQGENRVLLRHGLRELALSSKPGLQSLIRISGTNAGPNGGKRELSYSQVAFQLAPRINAAGRLRQTNLALELLLETDPARSTELAASLDRLNAERRTIQEEVFQEARTRVLSDLFHPDGPIVLAEPGWHLGVLGIAASKLAEEFQRPTILITLDGDIGKGSGRSAKGLHLYKALSECSDLLERFGGHKEAAGLTIQKERLGEFTERFSKVARGWMDPATQVPILEVDARVSLSDLTLETLQALDSLAPFGPGNARPVLCAEGLEVISPVRTVGKDGKHLKIELHDPASGYSAEGIGFGMGDNNALDYLNRTGTVVDAAFEPEINNWNGRPSLQLVLKDLRPSR